MIALIQRVSSAQVVVESNSVGKIDKGLLVLLGVEKHDDETTTDKLLKKIVNYRVFSDENDKMNLSLLDIGADILLVSQFTLVANTNKGLRPSFSSAADPKISKELYEYMIQQAKLLSIKVETGVFAADMKVSLTNDGPVTFYLKA
jgi:D-tyrosyl-tRNA(Tyr) deacylase